MKKFLLALCLISQSVWASSYVNVYSYSGGNVTTSAYTSVWSSTPISAGHLEICDTSGHILYVAIGASGSQQNIFSTVVSGCIIVPTFVPAGSQVWLKAIDANATTGYSVISVTGY